MTRKIISIKKIVMSKNLSLTIDKNKKILTLDVHSISLELPNSQLSDPRMKQTKKGTITIEDMENHPMNSGKRWGIWEENPSYELSDHQNRFIITLEQEKNAHIYIVPKFMMEGEPLAEIIADKKYSPIPFSIKMYTIKGHKILPIKSKKPRERSKIFFATQILGHVQDAAKILRWANKRGTLYKKWKFGLPATARTEVTKTALREEGILINKVINDWSYSGGKNFRTGLEFREYFNESDSFPTVAAFVAANAKLCLEVAEGKYAIFSTNFRSEAQLMKIINPKIITCGLSHTFLTGKLKNNICKHNKIPRLARMLDHVQKSLDMVPERITALSGDTKYIDYFWRLSQEKLRMLDILLYRTFSFDKNIPCLLNNSTQIVQIPMAIPDIKISKEAARNHISKIICKKFKKTDKIIILTGESEDGSLKKRIESLLTYALSNKNVHIIIPIGYDDKRIKDYDFPRNIHTIGFRKDWQKIIAGADIALIRGSWGEIIDVIYSQVIPVITSPSSVPMDADLDTTQFLTQISEERACNISMFIKTLQLFNVKERTINKLLVSFYDSSDEYSFQHAIEFALRPDVANEIIFALSKITKGDSYIEELHELLLKKRRVFSNRELEKLHNCIWKNGKEKV